MTGDAVTPVGIDTTVPHPARMYDYYLGGKDNFAADREAADEIIKRFPDTRLVAGQNRDFMRRVAAAMAQKGIRQFIDLGSGLPTRNNLHQVAQGIDPASRVLYVDNDPIVLVHGRALLAENERTRVITADLRDPGEVFGSSAMELIDLRQPVGLMMIAVLHFVPGGPRDLAALMSAYLEPLAPGSCLALTHVTAKGIDSERVAQATGTYQVTASGLHFRSPEEIKALFGGLKLLEPGVVPTWEWRSSTPPGGDTPRIGEAEHRPTSPIILAGVGQRS